MHKLEMTEKQAIKKLRAADLRPTRQRLAIAQLLLDGRARHVSAEQLQEELSANGQTMALATVYNCLHQFQAAGLLRHVQNAGDAVLYDTNLSDHCHFLDVETGELMDFQPSSVRLPELFDLPEGYKTESIELTVRLRRTKG